MKSVGETMAIGRTFQESLQKALRGLETGIDGLVEVCPPNPSDDDLDNLRMELKMPGADRLRYVADAFRLGIDGSEIAKLSGIDPWFLAQIEDLVDTEQTVSEEGLSTLEPDTLAGFEAQRFFRQPIGKIAGHGRKRRPPASHASEYSPDL